MPFKDKRAKRRKYYLENLSTILHNRKRNYRKNRDREQVSNCTYRKARHTANPVRARAGCRRCTQHFYHSNVQRARAISRRSSKAFYAKYKEQSQAASRSSSKRNYKRKVVTKCITAKRLYAAKVSDKSKATKAYYVKNRKTLCALRRDKYALAEPLHAKREAIRKVIQTSIFHNKEARAELLKAYKSKHPTLAQSISCKVLKTAVCRIAASKLLGKVFQVRRKQVGNLLATCRSINRMRIVNQADFGDGLHSKASEPVFYDSAYRVWPTDNPLPINEFGECVVAEQVIVVKKAKDGDIPITKYKCGARCKPLTEDEVDSIVALKNVFDNPINDVVRGLSDCDQVCPNMHHYHMFGPEGSTKSEQKLGHSLPCYNDTCCYTKLRILRCGAVHYPVLLRLLKYVYGALSDYSKVKVIDTALGTGDCSEILNLTRTVQYCDLLNDDTEAGYEQGQSDILRIVSKLRQPNLESQMMIEHAGTIDMLEKLTEDFAEHVCVSCERFFQWKNVSRIELSEYEIDSAVWLRLLAYVICTNPEANSEQLYICNYCKPRIRSNELPCRCVLNGLQTVPVPAELTKLDALSTQLIQRAKCYQTIVRLGTYIGKLPIYNSLKACKGTMFFLPLPMNRTLETLEQVQSAKTTLPDPELFIIVNGTPTKNKVVWRTLVDVNKVKKQ